MIILIMALTSYGFTNLLSPFLQLEVSGGQKPCGLSYLSSRTLMKIRCEMYVVSTVFCNRL